MRLKPVLAILIFFLSAFVFPFGACAEDSMQTGGVTIWADSLSHDQASDTYRATGNVMMVWHGAVLFADSAYLHETDNEAFAEGKVRLVKGADVLTCDRIKINLVTQVGEITNGDLFDRKSNYHMRGKKIIKLGEDKYQLDQGTFTPCNGDHPSWKFTASKVNVDVDQNGAGQNALFYIRDIPAFYFPYIVFPVQSERQSGFLFPGMGNSNLKGFNINLPYYWAISPSQEATVNLDMQTKRGVGLGFEYGYKLLNDSLGKITGYFIYDETEDKERGNLVTQQQQWLSPSLVLKTDLNLISDRTYLLDYSVTNGVYNAQVLDSSVSLTKNWQSYSLAGEFRYVDDLIAPSNTTSLEKLPEITFTAVRQKIIPGIPLYLSLDSKFDNFYRDTDIRGQRIELHPNATAYLAMPGGLNLSVWGGYRERLYNAYDAGPGETGTGSSGIGNADAGATLSSSWSRVFDTDWGSLKKLKHTIVPELGYSLVEEKNQDSLPFFDYNDRVLGHRMVTWAVSNYLSGKFQQGDATPEYRDLLYLRLSEGYQFSGLARDPITGTPRDLLTLVDEDRKLTDLRLEAKITPTKVLSIFTDSYYYPYNPRFSEVLAGFDLKSDKENTAGLSYRFARDQVQYLEGRFGLSLVKPFVFNFMGRYSFDGRNFLESLYSLEYRKQCWSIIFSYQDRPVLNDHAFMVSFNLAGIGKIKAH
jgi:LPS-assembly protein